MIPARRFLLWVAVCVLGALGSQAWAQSSPDTFDPSSPSSGGREFTVEVDTARGRNAERSLGLALLASAVLPGTGEAYLKEDRSARAFWLAEATFWTGLFIVTKVKANHMQSARNYASEYAGADAGGQGEAYLERMASFRSYREKEHRQDSYELNQVLTSQPMAVMPDWDFGSSATPENTARWNEYQSIMRHYRGAKVAISFAVGALVLNRAASMAHTLRVYRRTSGKGLSYYRFEPEFDENGSGLKFSVNF
jgi:hypothetical protein